MPLFAVEGSRQLYGCGIPNCEGSIHQQRLVMVECPAQASQNKLLNITVAATGSAGAPLLPRQVDEPHTLTQLPAGSYCTSYYLDSVEHLDIFRTVVFPCCATELLLSMADDTLGP